MLAAVWIDVTVPATEPLEVGRPMVATPAERDSSYRTRDRPHRHGLCARVRAMTKVGVCTRRLGNGNRKGESMTRTRLGRAAALLALVGLMSLGGFAQAAAAEDAVVCTTSGGCDYWELPDCSDIRAEDDAQWLAHLSGGPYPSRDLDYGNCLGF